VCGGSFVPQACGIRGHFWGRDGKGSLDRGDAQGSIPAARPQKNGVLFVFLLTKVVVSGRVVSGVVIIVGGFFCFLFFFGCLFV